MKFLSLPPTLLTAFAGLFLVSCGTNPFSKTQVAQTAKTPEAVNPHPVGSYEHFTFASYPGTLNAWKNEALLASSTSANTSVLINLTTQRGFLFVGNDLAMDYRVSTGSSEHKTPTGDFRITEKIQDKRSNLYGTLLDANGNTVNNDADSRKDTPPPGGKFLGAAMPYWMRLTNTGIGMHEGNVTRRYASHGCIRSHAGAVPIVFSKTKVGTLVRITE